jgi:hypothetical protein
MPPNPAVTGFAAYWERDAARSTPYPTPADVMLGASSLVLKMHESIPGIWLQESEGRFSVTVKPRFMPSGLPRYTGEGVLLGGGSAACVCVHACMHVAASAGARLLLLQGPCPVCPRPPIHPTRPNNHTHTHTRTRACATRHTPRRGL